MPYLAYRTAAGPARIAGARRRVRREFGNVLLAWISNVGGRPFRTAEEVECNSTYSQSTWNVSGAVYLTGSNRFGPTIRRLPSGGSAYTAWYSDGVSELTPVPASGITQGTFVLVGGSIGSGNDFALGKASTGGNAGHVISSTTTSFRANGNPYDTDLAHSFSHAANEPGSNVWSWKGGSVLEPWRNGKVGTGVTGTLATLPQWTHFYLGNTDVAPIGIDLNYLLWSDNPIPSTLAQAVSIDPWEAFEPNRKHFYYTGSGGGVSSSGRNLLLRVG